MISERTDREQPLKETTQASRQTDEGTSLVGRAYPEGTRAALALLLGPETAYSMRVRATRRLAKQGPSLLPLLLTTLSNYPEITSPPWPLWPPQYEHCSRLLLHLSQRAQMSLEALLQHPAVAHSAGPVLWTSLMEAAGLPPYMDYEALLCRGLEAPWMTVRYAAAMALATRAARVSLRRSTIEALYTHQGADEEIPVRLTAAYALLNSGEGTGVEVLIQLLDPLAPEEARKAAAFVLATELSFPLSISQRERLTRSLLCTLHDSNAEVALHAAHALSSIALPFALPVLGEMLDSPDPEKLILVLTALEELAQRRSMRRMMQQHALPMRIVPFLRNATPEIRRQACYTLAACGGEYVAAVLGTIVLASDHPGHIQAIEGLRLLRDVLRLPARTHVVHWLLQALRWSQEEVQVTALDSLAYLLWRTHRHKRVWQAMSREIVQDGAVQHLLSDPSAWVRQRAVELLGMLLCEPATSRDLHTHMRQLLHTDSDSGVRACVAYVYGKTAARWAIPDLIGALLDSDEHVAQTALSALSILGTPDDAVMMYVLQELTWHSDRSHSLAQSAKALLKKWRKSSELEARKKLQSAPETPIL